jgi:hypothetical protein
MIEDDMLHSRSQEHVFLNTYMSLTDVVGAVLKV